MDRHTITILDSRRARVEGRVAGEAAIIKHLSNVIVLRFPGRKVFSGQGQPQTWASAHYEVHTVLNRETIRGHVVLDTRHLVSFSAASHTWKVADGTGGS